MNSKRPDTALKAGNKHENLRIIIMLVLLAAGFLMSFTLGRYAIDAGDVVRILLSSVFPIEHTWTPQMETVVFNIRLPRILLACLVGCCLSAAGASYQGVFQNPMSSPDILGASSGAAFGAALAILFGMSSAMITVMAFSFSLLAVVIVYFIGQRAPGKRIVTFILAGIMVGSIFSSATSFVKLVADPTNQLPAITYWMMGSLSGTKKATVVYILIPMLIGLIPLFLLKWRINILTLGDEEAEALGVSPARMRLAVILCSTLVTAASVSVSGMIGWVGLVIPHLCRKIVGNNYKYLMPASMITGALFLLAVDNISRNLLATEIPIGILTSFIGAPFFIYLITKKEGKI